MANPERTRSSAEVHPAKPSLPKEDAGGKETVALAGALASKDLALEAVSQPETDRRVIEVPADGGSTAKRADRDEPQASSSSSGTEASTRKGKAAAANCSIGPRKPQFIIAMRQISGLQPLSADLVEQQLRSSPDIDFVKRIDPPRLLDLQSTDGAAGSLVLARMDFDKAQLLQAQAGPRATIERDHPLIYALDPGPAEIGLRNPGVLIPHAAGFQTTIQVTGDSQALSGAEVYVFGSVWPTQGVTDAEGRCTLTILGESPDTIRAIYVKPRIDYWSYWLPRPDLVASGVTTVEVKPLNSFLTQFPDHQLLGWGGLAMGLDQVPLSLNGAGVKVAIIDSGAAQKTHRNLHQMGPGLSIVGSDGNAWTEDTIGHGSHCAGIIAGGPVGPDGHGVRGFAPGAEIHICRIFPGGRFSDLIGALDYCMENGIDVVNMSLGGGEPSQIIEERLIRAKQMGIACIVAAGNSGGAVQFPASTPHTLAVAAVGKWGEFPPDSYHSQQALGGETSGSGYFAAGFSCFGPEIDVCAPGVGIVSSLPPDGFAAWDGTSMATPHVTGLAALVLAHHPDFKTGFQARDGRRVERLFQIIKESAQTLPVGGADRQGAGLPSAPRALGLAGARGAMAGMAAEPPSQASLEALRQLLAILGAGAQASSRPGDRMPPIGPQQSHTSASFQPASAGDPQMQKGRSVSEPWPSPRVARGAADLGLLNSWALWR